MHVTVRRTILAAALVVAALSITTGAVAKPPKPVKNHLFCFADGGATCSVNTAAQSARLDVPSGDDAGVYRTDQKISGSLLGPVTFSFDYQCDGTSNCVSGGSPDWAIPIDSNGDKNTDAYAFVDAQNCGQGGGDSGTVDETCPVAYAPDGVFLYENWAAFAAAHPSYKIANAITFMIAYSFHGTVSNITLSK